MELVNTSEKYINEIAKYKIKCPYCGHKVIVLLSDKNLCDWCGHYVYKEKKQMFKNFIINKQREEKR